MKLDRVIADQEKLARQVKVEPLKKKIATIAGADVAVAKEFLYSCLCVFSYPGLDLVCDRRARERARMPYVPGFLSYRELPVIVKAYERLPCEPDVLLVDGQGIAHPRRLGLASHLGVVLGIPTIGCAKSHLYGEYSMPGLQRGDYTMMKIGQENIGVVLRTRTGVKPLFVSPGHLVDIRDCMRIVLTVADRYRIPEPLRHAHKGAGAKSRADAR